MIRFLLDMGVAQSTAELLRSSGFDAVHLLEQSLERLPDEEIVAKAIEEHRIIVTHDLDFARIVALSRRSVPSIITLRLTNMTPANVNSAMRSALDEAMLSLEHGALLALTDRGTRVRQLPIDSG